MQIKKINWKKLRELARSVEYQHLYSDGNKIGVRMFRNSFDLTALQKIFLGYVRLYSSLYQDLAYEKENISEKIIQDDLRMEAYLVWKKKYGNKKDKKNQKKNNKFIRSDKPSVIFK